MNDWNQGPGGFGGPPQANYPQHNAPQAPAPVPRAATFDDVKRVMGLVRQSSQGMFIVWAVLFALQSVVTLGNGVLNYFKMSMMMEGALSSMAMITMGSLCYSLVLLVVVMFVAVATTGLQAVWRRRLVEGPAAVGSGFGEILKAALRNPWHVFAAILLYAVISMVGMVALCVGIFVVAFLLWPMAYLVAGPNVDVGESITRAYKIMTLNAGVGMIGVAVLVGVGLVSLTITGGVGFTVHTLVDSPYALMPGQFLSPPGQLAADLVSPIMGFVIGYPLLVFSTSMLIAMETAYHNVPLIGADRSS